MNVLVAGDDNTIPPQVHITRQLTAVVAMTPDRVIGLNGDMPWRLKSDLKRFKSLTMGGWLIMGRKTFESIGRPLPGRQTIVVTRNQNWSSPGVMVANQVAEVLQKVGNMPAFVVGGAEIYKLFWPSCDRVYVTWVWAKLQGDTWLDVNLDDFVVREQTRVPASSEDSFPTEFLRLERHSALGSGDTTKNLAKRMKIVKESSSVTT